MSTPQDEGKAARSPTVLVVEDDAALRRGLVFNLRREGYRVLEAGTAAAAEQALDGVAADLVVLDLGLPDRDGLDLLRDLRTAKNPAAVLCLTARQAETDVVMSLSMGADDHVAKPFSLAELLARIEAVLRRSAAISSGAVAGPQVPGDATETAPQDAPAPNTPAEASVGFTLASGLRYAPEEPALHHPGGRREELTPTERELLEALWAARGRALPREELLAQVWGLDASVPTRTLDNHVARLRRKLERDPREPQHLKTVHGVGYRMDP